MSVLRINNLSKRYGPIKAVDGLNLEIKAGNVYGILGPNGSGKTTTLGLILDIIKPDSGSFEWFDGQLKSPNLKIGAILETPNFFPYLDAVDNLEIIASIKNATDTDIDELLHLVNLYERKNSKFRSYSLGMKQRLAIAATLIGNPEVVIFDEPTNGLDPQGIAEVRRILKKVADSGRTVIMASHILDEVEKICSHVAIIKKGRLLAIGEVGAILSNDNTLELDATDRAALVNWLKTIPEVSGIKENTEWVQCSIKADYDVAQINQDASKAGIILTRLVSRKTRLEEEFLEITKSN